MITSYSTLLERVGHCLFGIRTGFSADQTSDITDCIRDGLHRVYTAHSWSFLRPLVEVQTTAPYVTGTITIASGVVTLVGGTFPAWAADGVLLVDSSYYSVATRDSNTQITLDATTVTVASAKPYQLARPEIPMDASFDAVANDSDLTYLPSAEVWYPPVRQRHDAFIRKMEQTNPEFDRPIWYSVRTVRFDPTVGSRKVLALYPTPDQAYTLRVPMILRPVMLDATDQYPIGGEVLSYLIMESCLSEAEKNFEEKEATHTKRFMEMLPLAIQTDKERSSPTSLGPDAPRFGRSGGLGYHHAREQRLGGLTLDGDAL